MSNNTKLLKSAKFLRIEMTKAEKILWQKLRAKRLNGLKFRRQEPLVLGQYHTIVDFYCPVKKLIIEIDGSIHDDESIKSWDDLKDEVFTSSGYEILRISNEEIFKDLNKVILKIEKALS